MYRYFIIVILVVLYQSSDCLFRYFIRGKPGTSIIVGLGQKEKCMKNLGCFNIGPPFFHPISRPLSFLPKNREKIHTKFYLYTNRNPQKKERLISEEKETILNSQFESKWPTKILITGYTASIFFSITWFPRIKDAFLSVGNYNVIFVEWVFGSATLYGQAAANARVVGAEIAFLVKRLQELKGIKPESVHIIGMSLGAQTAGYAGKRIKNLGRITGLDPAGPYFQDVSPEVRLDSTDAIFVDVIHTNTGKTVLHGLGTDEVVGDMDFFPNGGWKQPTCKTIFKKEAAESITDLMALANPSACNHVIAMEYFLVSITNRNCFVSVACDSFRDYLKGKCSCGSGNQCAVMGLDADKYYVKNGSRVFYLKTGIKYPFCNHQYKLTIWPARNSVLKAFKEKFDILFQNQNRFKLISTLFSRLRRHNQGDYYTLDITSEEPLERVREVLIKQKTNEGLHFSSQRKGDEDIIYMKLTPVTSNKNIWCGRSSEPIYPGKPVLISPTDCYSIPPQHLLTSNTQNVNA